MADLEEKLSGLLRKTGLNAKKQDGKIILYNRQLQHLSRGLLVKDIEMAVRMAQNYLAYLRTQGFLPLVDWAADHQGRPIPHKEVNNRVDSQSAYYVQALSSVSRINLLQAARELEARVHASRALREDSPPSESNLRRHLKIKKIAAIYRSDSEKVV